MFEGSSSQGALRRRLRISKHNVVLDGDRTLVIHTPLGHPNFLYFLDIRLIGTVFVFPFSAREGFLVSHQNDIGPNQKHL